MSGSGSAAVTFAVLGLLFGIASFVMVVILYTDPRMSMLPGRDGSGSAAGGQSGKDGGMDGGDQKNDILSALGGKDGGGQPRTHLLGVENDWKPYAFIDDSGYLKGVYVDVMREVCQRAGKQCRFAVTTYEDCWSAETLNGLGLQGKWYETCSVYGPTMDRGNVFKFAGGLVKTPHGNLYTKTGSTLTASDAPNRKIGYWLGWATDNACLVRHDIKVPSGQQVIYDTTAEGLAALNNDEVDMLFWPAGDHGLGALRKLATDYKCYLGAAGLMMRKDSDIDTWYEPIFKAMKEEGKLKEHCDGSLEKFGVEAECDL